MCIRVIEENAEPYLRRDYMPGTLVPKLNLRGFKFFAGKLLYEDINLDERWTLAVRYDGMHDPNDFNGDFRNWDTISEWAHKIGAEITQFS